MHAIDAPRLASTAICRIVKEHPRFVPELAARCPVEAGVDGTWVPLGDLRPFPILDKQDGVAPHRAEGRVGSGLLATAIDDLELHILESLDELHVPLSLTRGVMSAALQDFLDNARPAYLSDWLSLAGQVRDLPRERVIDYIAAQTADGPLVPAGASPDPNGPR